MDERWLSVNEIAEHLGVSKDTIYRRLQEGDIPAHRIGKFWKFKLRQIDAWVMRGKASTVNRDKKK